MIGISYFSTSMYEIIVYLISRIIKKYGSMKSSVEVGFPAVYVQVYKLTEKPFDREDEKKRSTRLCTPPFPR